MKKFLLMSVATISVAGLLIMGCRKDGTKVINNGLAAAGTGPWSVLAGAATASLYAQYCVCSTCAKYGNVSCNKK